MHQARPALAHPREIHREAIDHLGGGVSAEKGILLAHQVQQDLGFQVVFCANGERAGEVGLPELDEPRGETAGHEEPQGQEGEADLQPARQPGHKGRRSSNSGRGGCCCHRLRQQVQQIVFDVDEDGCQRARDSESDEGRPVARVPQCKPRGQSHSFRAPLRAAGVSPWVSIYAAPCGSRLIYQMGLMDTTTTPPSSAEIPRSPSS